jgi:hypothetical protein
MSLSWNADTIKNYFVCSYEHLKIGSPTYDFYQSVEDYTCFNLGITNKENYLEHASQTIKFDRITVFNRIFVQSETLVFIACKSAVTSRTLAASTYYCDF